MAALHFDDFSSFDSSLILLVILGLLKKVKYSVFVDRRESRIKKLKRSIISDETTARSNLSQLINDDDTNRKIRSSVVATHLLLQTALNDPLTVAQAAVYSGTPYISWLCLGEEEDKGMKRIQTIRCKSARSANRSLDGAVFLRLSGGEEGAPTKTETPKTKQKMENPGRPGHVPLLRVIQMLDLHCMRPGLTAPATRVTPPRNDSVITKTSSSWRRRRCYVPAGARRRRVIIPARLITINAGSRNL